MMSLLGLCPQGHSGNPGPPRGISPQLLSSQGLLKLLVPSWIPVKKISFTVSTMSRKWVKLTERKSSLSRDEFIHEISSFPIKIIVWAVLGWEDSHVCSFSLDNFILLDSHTPGYLRSTKASSPLLGMYLKSAFAFFPYLEGFQFSKDSFWYCWNVLFSLIVFLLFLFHNFFLICVWRWQQQNFGPINLWYVYSILRTMIHLQW